jgi:hypothetical protein
MSCTCPRPPPGSLCSVLCALCSVLCTLLPPLAASLAPRVPTPCAVLGLSQSFRLGWPAPPLQEPREPWRGSRQARRLSSWHRCFSHRRSASSLSHPRIAIRPCSSSLSTPPTRFAGPPTEIPHHGPRAVSASLPPHGKPTLRCAAVFPNGRPASRGQDLCRCWPARLLGRRRRSRGFLHRNMEEHHHSKPPSHHSEPQTRCGGKGSAEALRLVFCSALGKTSLHLKANAQAPSSGSSETVQRDPCSHRNACWGLFLLDTPAPAVPRPCCCSFGSGHWSSGI